MVAVRSARGCARRPGRGGPEPGLDGALHAARRRGRSTRRSQDAPRRPTAHDARHGDDRRAARRHRACVSRSPARPSTKVGRRRPQARARCPTVVSRISPKPAAARAARIGRRIVAGADERVGVAGRRLDQRLEPPARPVGQPEVGGHERMAAVDGRDHERAARPQPAAQVGQRRRRVVEVLEREARQHHVERRRRRTPSASRHRSTIANSSRWGSGAAGCVDVGADEPVDPRPERPQRRDPAAAGVEDRDGARRARLGRARRRDRAPRGPGSRRSVRSPAAAAGRSAPARSRLPGGGGRGLGDALRLEPALGVDRGLAAVARRRSRPGGSGGRGRRRR